MSDFPYAHVRQMASSIASDSHPSGGHVLAAIEQTPTTSGVVAQNQAWYIPFLIYRPYVARKMWIVNGSGTINGNMDMGIYTSGGTRIVSMGNTAQATVNFVQTLDITDTLLAPGQYYMAFSSSSATATYWRYSVTAPLLTATGIHLQGSANPLPATASFGTNTTNTVLPTFGVTGNSVI